MKLHKNTIVYPLVAAGLGLNILGCDKPKQNVTVKPRQEESLRVELQDIVVDDLFRIPDSVAYFKVDFGNGDSVEISEIQRQRIYMRNSNGSDWYNYSRTVSMDQYEKDLDKMITNGNLVERRLRQI